MMNVFLAHDGQERLVVLAAHTLQDATRLIAQLDSDGDLPAGWNSGGLVIVDTDSVANLLPAKWKMQNNPADVSSFRPILSLDLTP